MSLETDRRSGPDPSGRPRRGPGATAPRSDPSPLDAGGNAWARPGQRPGSRNWFRRGRWQVERERCGLDAVVPDPPFQEAEPVRKGLHRALGRLGLESAAVQAVLLAEWSALLGEDIAGHTRPGALRNGELTVFVRGALWYAELHRHALPLLQEKLAARFAPGSIRRVVLRPDPEGGLAP